MSAPHKEIETLLRRQSFSEKDRSTDIVYRYAESLSIIEKSIVVVSDMKCGTSRIFYGGFAALLGLKEVTDLPSIWEKEVLGKMPSGELEEKYLSELRFYNYLRHIPRSRRAEYYLATHVRMTDKSGGLVDVLHRMYYWYEAEADAIRFAICIYEPMMLCLPAKSMIINSLTGLWEELSTKNDRNILSLREKQVLALIEQGLTSRDIADRLCISKNTVSRHRQEILAKLQVKNSAQACQRAKQLSII